MATRSMTDTAIQRSMTLGAIGRPMAGNAGLAGNRGLADEPGLGDLSALALIWGLVRAIADTPSDAIDGLLHELTETPDRRRMSV